MKIWIFISVLVSAGIQAQELTLDRANSLARLPLKCLQQEYPNKLNQLLIDSSELQSPKELHPTFYGCFDWHSAVHGHWSLLYLLNYFPDLQNKQEIIQKLKVNLSAENITKELAYFAKKHEKSFERTYGWAWLLKLQAELDKSKDCPELAVHLRPLTDTLIKRYMEFLPKLLYPVRAGTHNNTAFGLNLAWDYAVSSNNLVFQNCIQQNAIRLFKKDKDFSFAWEPSGTDFLSPGFEEITLMKNVLSKIDFFAWLKPFANQLLSKKFKLEVAKVSDRTDGHLVHLDGLNFSRAWNMYALIETYPKEFAHLKPLAAQHFKFSLPTLVDGNYEGEHWLASFALYAFERLK
jgi:hypothetical protein